MAEQELPTKHCWDCGETEDVAQCPDCRGWFCGKHNVHTCIPDPQSARAKRYAAIEKREVLGIVLVLAGVSVGYVTFGAIMGALEVAEELSAWDRFSGQVYLLTFISVALVVLGCSLWWYYHRQVKQFPSVHGFNPQTAKKDR